MRQGTKKLIALGMGIAVTITGGCATAERETKSWFSDLAGGLERTITLYDEHGDVIHEWEGKLDIQTDGRRTLFDMDGKRVVINGGIVVTEEQ